MRCRVLDESESGCAGSIVRVVERDLEVAAGGSYIEQRRKDAVYRVDGRAGDPGNLRMALSQVSSLENR